MARGPRFQVGRVVVVDRDGVLDFDHARVLPISKVDLERHRIDVRFEVERGAIAKVAAIDVVGAHAERVRAVARMRIGDVFTYGARRTDEGAGGVRLRIDVR